MRRILLSFLSIGVVALIAFGASRAFFSDTEKSTGNTFTAGAIDLKIDNTSYYNGEFWPNTSWQLDDLDGHLFFNFTDIKPGDWGEDTVSLHVVNNDAWACWEIEITDDDDVTCTEPENIDDPTCGEPDEDVFDGELGDQVNFIFWIDDGDNVFETDEELTVFAEGKAIDIPNTISGALADADENFIRGNLGDPLIGGETYYIAKSWCFGTLTPTPLEQDQQGPESNRTPANSSGGISCDGSQVNNAAQTDILRGDVTFSAIQSRHNPGFVCKECFETVYVDSVVLEGTSQGTKKSGATITSPRDNPNNALGPNDWLNGTGTNFFSIGKNGSITLAFSFPVKNGAGDDLSFHEATNGRNSYPLESADVYVSLNGTDFQYAGTVTSEPGGDGIEYLDLSTSTSFSEIRYVELIDTTNFGPHNNNADGYDLDAVDAIYGPCEQ